MFSDDEIRDSVGERKGVGEEAPEAVDPLRRRWIIFGVTATPNRGDRKGLREVFDNVADQVRLGELIASGHLVPPRTFVIDVGVQEKLRAVRKTASDYDMSAVAEIMNRAPITAEVIRHWREKAGEAPLARAEADGDGEAAGRRRSLAKNV